MATLAENVNKVVAAHAAIKAAVAAKGVAVPDGAKLTDIPALVAGIQIDTAAPVPAISFYGGLVSGDAVLGSVVKCDLTQATNVSNCFSASSGLTSLTLPDGFGSAATNVSYCFSACSGLTSLTLPDGFGSAATNVSNCFSASSGLTSLTLPDGFGSAATDVSNCFNACSGLTSLTLPDGFGSAATDVSNCFNACSGLTSLTLPDGFGSAATDVSNCFNACSGLTSLTLPDGFGSAATDVSNCFRQCTSLISLDLGSQFGVNATTTFQPFYGLSALENLTGAIKLKSNFRLSDSSRLTHDSLANVINGLVTVADARILWLGETNKAKLTEDEIAVATAKGWTIS